MDTLHMRPLELGALRWWRFARYVIRGGYVRPASGRLIRYNVWDAYDVARATGKGQRPYESLFGLVSDDPFATERAVIRWHEQHGPLGLLLHRCIRADPPPYYTTTPALPAQPVVRATRYVWTGDGWLYREADRLLGASHSGARPYGKAAPRALWPPNIDYAGMALMHPDLIDPAATFVPLESSWRPFFPEIVNTQTYPPGSDTFCHLYAEPLTAFLDAAKLFVNVVEALRDSPPSPGALRVLGELTRDTRAALFWHRRERKLIHAWLSRSLLGSYATMVTLDVAEVHRRFLRCEVCGHLFGTDHPRARHCSPRCQATNAKRRQRAGARYSPSRTPVKSELARNQVKYVNANSSSPALRTNSVLTS